jgi:SAM-dependent methyltransferase
VSPLRRSGRRPDAVAGAAQPIELFGDATPESFEPAGYLFANGDVAAAAGTEDELEFATWHFENHGRNEDRRQLRASVLPQLVEARRTKMDWLYRRSPTSASLLEQWATPVCGLDLPLLRVRGEARLPVPFERVSAHNYDAPMQHWFDEDPSLLFLDVGAGSRPLYRRNVVFTEIGALPSTDVLCFGDSLPFDDDVFDGVVALSVLEHVPDPFSVVAELVRVVRPGCQVIVDWPFLQPVHGYPDHYFNATPNGARQAFERLENVDSVRSSFPSFLHPAYTLRWILDEWMQALPAAEQASFAELRVADVLAQDGAELEMQAWSRLPADRMSLIAAGSRVVATKSVTSC